MSTTPPPASARLVWAPRVPRLRPRFLQARERFRRRRRGGSKSGDGEGLGGVATEGCLDVFGEWAFVVLAVVVALALAWFFVIPLLLLLIDAVVLAIVAAVAFATRVLFRRPWRIEVARGDEIVGAIAVVGIGNARRRRDEIVAALAVGIDPATLVDQP